MALSDELTKLAARATEAEERAVAARTEARAQLEQDVKAAREAAQVQAEDLSKAVDADLDAYSEWWADAQKSWNDHIAVIRRNIDEKRVEHDLNAAKRGADIAEADAGLAVNFALGAIQEAEYAVLDATLARMNADSLAGSRS